MNKSYWIVITDSVRKTCCYIPKIVSKPSIDDRVRGDSVIYAWHWNDLDLDLDGCYSEKNK